MLDAQQKDILAIKAKIELQPEKEEVKKVKGKGRTHDDFYRVSIPIFYTIFNVILLIIICITEHSFISIKILVIWSLKIVLSRRWMTMNIAPINSKGCTIVAYPLINFGTKNYIRP